MRITDWSSDGFSSDLWQSREEKTSGSSERSQNMSDPNLREIACKTMIALAEGDFAKADANFHPDAQWWIIGQGDLSHSRVRELAEQTEGPAMLRQLNITGTRSEEHTYELQSLIRKS